MSAVANSIVVAKYGVIGPSQTDSDIFLLVVGLQLNLHHRRPRNVSIRRQFQPRHPIDGRCKVRRFRLHLYYKNKFHVVDFTEYIFNSYINKKQKPSPIGIPLQYNCTDAHTLLLSLISFFKPLAFEIFVFFPKKGQKFKSKVFFYSCCKKKFT